MELSNTLVPRLARPRRIHRIVQAIDVAPTILELAGLPALASTQGRSLVPLLRTGSDPKEQHNRIAQRPQVAARLARRLDEQVGGSPSGPAVDPKRWRQEHGYW